MKKQKKTIDIILFITTLAIYTFMVLETLFQAYPELLMTFLVVNLISVLFEVLSYISAKKIFSYLGLGLSIALVILMIGYPSFYSYTGLIFIPLMLLVKIALQVKNRIELKTKDKVTQQ